MSEYIVCPYCHNPLSQSKYVEVVRCRDCRFAIAKGYGCGRGNEEYLDVEPNGFCAWGEREMM